MSAAFIIHNGSPQDAIARITLVLEQHGRRTRAVATAAALAADPHFAAARRALVVVMAPDATREAEETLLAFLEGAGRGAVTVYVADSIAAPAYKRLVRAGGEWLTKEGVQRELPDVMRRADAVVEESADGAVVVAFLPSKGGVGNTTLVAECGVAAARRAKKSGGRIAAVDLNVQSGALADLLDMEARLDFSEIMTRPERLDARLAEIFVSSHASGLDVYASASRGIPFDEVNGRALFALIDQLSHLYTTVLVDLPALRFSWTDTLLAGADAVVVTGTSEVPALKRLAEQAALLDRLDVDPARVAFAVNRCEAKMIGGMARKAEIARALPGREVYLIRRDTDLAAEAADLGRPVVDFAPNKPLGRDIRALAERVAAVTPRQAAAAGARAAA